VIKSTMKLFDRQKYNPFTVPVPGTDSAAITAEREAVLAEQTALENQLPQKQKPRQCRLLGGAITITLPPRSPKQP